jgi:hypothetical protein
MVILIDPLPDKGRLRFFVCGEPGRRELIRLTRHRSAANAALDRAARGDALAIHPEDAGSGALRVSAETTIAASET